MIINLSNEIKQKIIQALFIKNNSIQAVFTVEMYMQLRTALNRKGFNLDNIDDQGVNFEIYGYQLDMGGITGYNSHGAWFSFGLLYDFENFTEDIDSVYLIDQTGDTDTLTI